MIARRRDLLAFLPSALLSTLATGFRGMSAEEALHALKGDNLDRLRLDFNASRSKVRLLFLLSPT